MISRRVRIKHLDMSIRQARWFCEEAPAREKMNYDVAIVGGGIAGLTTAIKLKQ